MKECWVDSSLGGEHIRCGNDGDGHNVFSDVYIANMYEDQQGAGVDLDITFSNVVGGDSIFQGNHRDPDHTINASVATRRGITLLSSSHIVEDYLASRKIKML